MTSSKIIQKVRKAFFKTRLSEQVARAHEKVEIERGAAEIELIMDDVQSEGIDPKSPLGLACVAEIWKAKQQEIHAEIHDGEADQYRDGFTRGDF